jgi:phage terminase large subunit
MNVDVWAGYHPLPAQERFHRSTAKWRLYAGAVGAGKTKAGSREAIRTAIEYPNSLGIIGRKEYRPLMDSTWRTFLRELDMTGLVEAGLAKVTGGKAASSPPHVKFWNGSEIMFRNAKSEQNFLGVEPDWVYLDEGSEISDEVYEMLGAGRLRGTPNPEGKTISTQIINGKEVEVRVSGPLRIWVTCNPGPSSFIRKNFVPPGVRGKRSQGFEVFAARTDENPYLPPEYVEEIKKRFSGARHAAYVRGDWGAFEGQVFTEFDANVHVIDDVPPESLRGKLIIEGWDFGRAVETAVIWMAVDEEGEDPIIVFADYGVAELEPSEHAKNVREMRRRFGIKEVMAVGDPAGRARGASGSYMEEYARQGIFISPCDKGKRQGIRDQRLAQLLASRLIRSDGSQPALVICRRCAGLIESITAARYKPGGRVDRDRPDERVKKDDHRLDALEYALMVSPPPREEADDGKWREYLADGLIAPGTADLERARS